MSQCWLRVAVWLILGGVFSAMGVSALEVQSHGLLFEKWLRDAFFGGYVPQGYTQKWDIPAEANREHGGIPVNPKAIKYGTPIGLGDAMRQFEIDEPFLLIVGFWKQVSADKKTWVNVQAVRVEPEIWRKLWGKVKRDDVERLMSVIKDKSLSLEEARAKAKEVKAQTPFDSSIIELNPKIDSKQRRLQCSLRFDAFFDHLAPQASREEQGRPQLFGVPVPGSFESAPRVIMPEK